MKKNLMVALALASGIFCSAFTQIRNLTVYELEAYGEGSDGTSYKVRTWSDTKLCVGFVKPCHIRSLVTPVYNIDDAAYEIQKSDVLQVISTQAHF